MSNDSVDSDREDERDGFVELHPRRDDLGTRLDRYVADQLPDLSRGTVQGLIESGRVRVDGQQRKPKFRMTPGEVVSVEIPPPQIDEILPDPIPLDIVYEDADVIVVDKPAGMVVHPAPGHPRETLANALVAHVPGISVGGSQRPGIVHRLDKDTSGVLLVAKNETAANQLEECFANEKVDKQYVCLLVGRLQENEGALDFSLPGRTGKPVHALTRFRVIKRFPETTLVRVNIPTGRMHQIRLHFAKYGYPVVMDDQHGDFAFNKQFRKKVRLRRQFLHASSLTLEYRGKKRTWTASLPADLAETLEWLEAR
jgi:23S rRNA pseudouridine1911/1915/1917 synthase